MLLQPRDWASFQHYKDRSPSWVKLHKSLLDNYEFQCLPVASRALAPMLWLLASESKDLETGAIEFDVRKLSFRLRMTEEGFESAVKPLIDNEFFSLSGDASSTLADGEQESILEKRREEKEKEEKSAAPIQTIVDLYHEHLPSLPSIRLMGDPRKKAIKTFWTWVLTSAKSDGNRRATTPVEAIEWIGDYFARAAENDFIMGRTKRTAEHANWKPDIDYLLSDKGKKQVIEKTGEAA